MRAMEQRDGNRFKRTPQFSRIASAVFLLLTLTLSLLHPFSPAAAEMTSGLPTEIKNIMESPRYRYARWGLFVLDIPSGEPLLAYNADILFGPASVTKLFTVGAALDELGRDYTIRTPLYQRGRVDKSKRLQGDLILLARGGEISLSSLRALAGQVKASGIGAVTGDVVIDDRLFVPYRAYSVSLPGKLLYVVSPALVQDNMIEITIRPTRMSAAASVAWQPKAPWLRITNRLRTAAGSEPEQIIITEDRAGHMFISGQIPLNAPAVTEHMPVSDPASLLRSLFIEALKKAGVRVQASSLRPNDTARLPNPGAYGELVKVAERMSPPLGDYARSILKISHNQGADLLPLLMAVKNGRNTFEEGMKRERIFLARTGIDLGALSLGDGSGISPANMVTPRTVVQYLKFMTTHRDFDVFRNGLPILGIDGTLGRAGGEGCPAKGKILAKTGTISLFDLLNDSGFTQYKTLGGYMTTASGRSLAFALFVNHVHATDAPDRKTVQKLNGDVGADLIRIAEQIYLHQ